MRRGSNRKIKITKGGYSFILITLGIGVAGLNTGNNLLYLLFGMMLSFIIISGILSDSSMRKLGASREIPKETTAKIPFPVKLSVRNFKKFLPAYSISIEDVGEQGPVDKSFIVKVPPEEKEDVFYSSKFHERGLKRFSGFRILTKYPFGLIQKTDFLKGEDEILVYPEIIELEKVFAGDRFFHGEYLSGEKGSGVNPWGLRSYFYGDDARLIHWKSTAKRGEWMVKEFESEKKLKVVVDLILLNPEFFASRAFAKRSEAALIEKLISICASFIIYLTKVNYEVVLTINEDFVNGSERRFISNYLKSLALLDVNKLPYMCNALRSPLDGGSTHVVITNLSAGRITNAIESVGFFVDRDSYKFFDTGRSREGSEH